ncbi:MAG: hypothetical protein ACD_65C00324G0003, partial [uncultured bacterium]
MQKQKIIISILTFTMFLILAPGISKTFAFITASPRSSDEGDLELLESDYTQTIACEDPLDATHAHGYENTTVPAEDHSSYMVLHKFRIYLHDDFVDEVDFDTLECSGYDEWISCDGGYSDGFGGTETELVLGDTSSDAVYENYVEWTYGTDDITDKPLIPGKNDYDEDGSIDTTEDDRDMAEYIYFEFEDDDEGTAATTSAVYVQFWSYDRDCGDPDDSACWNEVEEDGETDKHWNNHTYTVETDYICEEIYCEDLDMTPTSLTAEEAEDTIEIVASSEANDGTNWEDADDFAGYKFWANDNTGSLSDGVFTRYSWSPTIMGSNPYTTSSNTAYYKNGTAGDTIYVCAINDDGDCLTPDYVDDYPGNCIAAVTSTPTEITCDYMTMTPSGTLTAPGESYTQDITIATYGTDGNIWENTADWTLTCTSASINPPSPTDTNETVTYIETSHAEEE